ncbi:hypothetical protein GGTG_07767 [Gaeumannomyces tritici R3-111a-1]|uniref:Guanine nucleotide exchange factor synembryn n=1 Tax=Gaeumannomyces tritici (strain R3-111a-1) TaxID=644352 RepID=J3P2M1_GAET3|nr:hypothetical protein GGTG_07767 [Gaeumannomyces tritici R3-111a-1]EJT73913.1 hypothetical protein GGTG_07767 [Gaeumannomyces tritici R3-111a-1]
MAQALFTGTLTGSAKRSAVQSLLDKLTLDLKEQNLSPQDRDAALEELKIYGRDPRDADPIFTKEGIAALLAHAFDSASDTTSRNALRCLANAMVLSPASKKFLFDLGYESKACAKLKNDSWDDEFLISRILLLATYVPGIDQAALITKYDLADSIVKRLARHAEIPSSKVKEDPMEDMALAETLKLLFNLGHFCPEQRGELAPAIPSVVKMIYSRPLPAGKPLDPPFGPLVNALVDMDLRNDDANSALFPGGAPSRLVERMIPILGSSLRSYRENEMEATIAPLVGVLGRIYEVAPEAEQQLMREKLLPAKEDREQVLGSSGSLPSRLLNNSTNPLAPELGKSISHLLFDLSGRDAMKFIENVGYGFASGFLFSNNIEVPDGALGAAGSSSGTASGSGGKDVNPITGQFLDAENLPEMPAMTQEEKEREAERLFVLFERLKKTGIVDVQNPVEKAFQEGRFEELDDDYDEDEDKKQGSDGGTGKKP